MLKYILAATSFILLSCSSPVEKRNINNIFIGSGVEKFFLADPPDWTQFSEIAGCQFKERIRYLNFENLNASYFLKYEELVQLQYLVNQEFRISGYYQTKEEEKVFYSSYEKVKGGTKAFIPPSFSRIHLIWIDDFINSNRSVEELKSFLRRDEVGMGFPVFVSLCLSEKELEGYVSDNELGFVQGKTIPRDMFTLYSGNYKRESAFSLDFKKIFKSNSQIYFYSPRKYKTNNFLNYDYFKTF